MWRDGVGKRREGNHLPKLFCPGFFAKLNVN